MNTTALCPHGYRIPDDTCWRCELARLREENEQLRADADLGELVRRMPEGFILRHDVSWYAYGTDGKTLNAHLGVGERPEEALREALEGMGEGEG